MIARGIIQTDFELSEAAAKELSDRFREWEQTPGRPLVLGRGVHYRTIYPDGSVEPIHGELVELHAERSGLFTLFVSGCAFALSGLAVAVSLLSA